MSAGRSREAHLAPDEIALLLTEVVEHDEAKRLESPGHSIDKAERRLQLAGQPALARRCALWKAKQKRNVVGDVLVSTAPQEVVPAACAPQARALATGRILQQKAVARHDSPDGVELKAPS